MWNHGVFTLNIKDTTVLKVIDNGVHTLELAQEVLKQRAFTFAKVKALAKKLEVSDDPVIIHDSKRVEVLKGPELGPDIDLSKEYFSTLTDQHYHPLGRKLGDYVVVVQPYSKERKLEVLCRGRID